MLFVYTDVLKISLKYLFMIAPKISLNTQVRKVCCVITLDVIIHGKHGGENSSDSIKIPSPTA